MKLDDVKCIYIFDTDIFIFLVLKGRVYYEYFFEFFYEYIRTNIFFSLRITHMTIPDSLK